MRQQVGGNLAAQHPAPFGEPRVVALDLAGDRLDQHDQFREEGVPFRLVGHRPRLRAGRPPVCEPFGLFGEREAVNRAIRALAFRDSALAVAALARGWTA